MLAFRVARRNVSNGFPQGLRSDRIAERMGITGPTVDLHLGRARNKLGAETRAQALVKALSLGLIDP